MNEDSFLENTVIYYLEIINNKILVAHKQILNLFYI